MTVTPISPMLPQPPSRPRGWTDEALADLVARVRAGAELDELADALGRSTQTLLVRLRLLLPVDERRCPSDRVVPRLREHLTDAAYDWRDAMLRTPPPAPVVRNEIQGLPGLTRHHLLSFTHAAFNSPLEDEELLQALRTECERRGVARDAKEALRSALVDGRCGASGAELTAMVEAWWRGTCRYLGSDRYRGIGGGLDDLEYPGSW